MKKPTIADVAARAGVAKSTVSYALSGARPISEPTRRRIQKAIDELGFRPDPIAQRLAGGPARTIGCVYPLNASQIPGVGMEFISTASSVINEAEYAFLLLTHLRGTDDHLERFIQNNLVDGFLVMQIQMQDPRIEMLKQSGLPFVMIGRCEENRDLVYVDSDIEAAVARCVDLLVDQGHRALAYLYQHDPGFGFLERSLRGFIRGCEGHGVQATTLGSPAPSRNGEALMNALLDSQPETTGVIAWSAQCALGAMQAIQARDLRVPEEISITCFRDPLTSSLLPAEMVMVDIQPVEVATRAAQMMLAMIEGETLDETQVLMQARLLTGEGVELLPR